MELKEFIARQSTRTYRNFWHNWNSRFSQLIWIFWTANFVSVLLWSRTAVVVTIRGDYCRIVVTQWEVQRLFQNSGNIVTRRHAASLISSLSNVTAARRYELYKSLNLRCNPLVSGDFRLSWIDGEMIFFLTWKGEMTPMLPWASNLDYGVGFTFELVSGGLTLEFLWDPG